MKIVGLIVSSALFLVLSCTNNEVSKYKREYIIRNETNLVVNIKFLSRSNGLMNNSTSGTLDSEGNQLINEVEQDQLFTSNEDFPIFAHDADSAIVIINNKFFVCVFNTITNTFSEPINRNLFKHSNYENLGNERYLFKITQEDYENALPCNDNCD
ncbi:MAG: hypothetical protein ACK5JD_17475 [Mangrovibacterium sp.]